MVDRRSESYSPQVPDAHRVVVRARGIFPPPLRPRENAESGD